MKVSAAFLTLCLLINFANSHVVFSPWSLIDRVCQRPASGECSKAGSCCGRLSGTQRMERTCEADHCDGDPNLLKRTRRCRIRCWEADAGAYGRWTRAGNCVRPSSGQCSADNTCCGKVAGLMKHVRTCEAANGCAEGTLERDFRCNVRCGYVHPCNVWPNPCENGGTCTKDGHSHGCICAPGWTGHHCDTQVCPSPPQHTSERGESTCEADGVYAIGHTCTYTCLSGISYGARQSTCTEGVWSAAEPKCYFAGLSPNERSYGEYANFCKNVKYDVSHIPLLNGDLVFDDMATILREQRANYFVDGSVELWTGMKYNTEDETLELPSGEKAMSPIRWFPGQPDLSLIGPTAVSIIINMDQESNQQGFAIRAASDRAKNFCAKFV